MPFTLLVRAPCAKMLPECPLDAIFVHFLAQRGKCSQEASRTPFWRIRASITARLYAYYLITLLDRVLLFDFFCFKNAYLPRTGGCVATKATIHP